MLTKDITKEDLQTRLNEQQGDGIAINYAESTSHQASNTDNEDESSEGANEPHYSQLSSTDMHQNFGDMQCWSAPVAKSFPMMPPAPLEDINNLHPSLVFSALDQQQVQAQAQATLGTGLHLTSMICTDL